MSQNADSSATNPKNRTTAALLALFLGIFGIHQFYLGNKLSGIIRIVLTATIYGVLVSLPLAIVEFVMYLTASDEQFHQNYVSRKKAWPWSTPSERNADESGETTTNKKLIIGAIVGAVLLAFIGCVAMIASIGEDFDRLDRINDQLDRALDQNDRAMDQFDKMLGP